MTYVLDSKDFVFTGGEFGIESSIIALLGYVIVTLDVYKRQALNLSPSKRRP